MTTPDIVNIASFLPIMAKNQPHEPAIVLPKGRDRDGRAIYKQYTFEQLEKEVIALPTALKLLVSDGACALPSWSVPVWNSSL